jgi:hypothetical protein
MIRHLAILALVAVATVAAGVSAALAETGGFFVIDDVHATIFAGESGGHQVTISGSGLEGDVSCATTFIATNISSTPEDLTFTPTLENCIISGTEAKVPVDPSGCTFTFTVAKASTEKTEQTLHLNCPLGKKLTITRPGCTIAIAPQTIQTGVTYRKASNFGSSALTMSLNAGLALQYEAGACTSLGTTQTGVLKGSLTVRAYDTELNPTGIDVTWDKTVGHFASGVEHPTIVGSESGEHHLDFIAHGLGGEIGCEKSTYSLTDFDAIAETTVVNPVFEKCTTTGGGTVLVGFAGCGYRFDVVGGTTSETEQKVDLVCPAGESPIVWHANCLMRIPPQNDIGKITYTTAEEGGDHAITLDVNAEFNVQFENGPCTLLGTSQTGTLKGSVTVKAFDTGGEQVDLTAT